MSKHKPFYPLRLETLKDLGIAIQELAQRLNALSSDQDSLSSTVDTVKQEADATAGNPINEVSSVEHGLAPQSPGDPTKFLNGDYTPKYAAVKDSDLSLSDTASNNVSSTEHGFTPKAPADPKKYLNGDTTPAFTQVKGADLLLTDVTTNNVSSTEHGFAPKSPADATKFLNGDTSPAYAQVKDSDLSTSNVTTNDVSITKHGFAPKAPNDATKYLDGTGAWSTPAGSGGGSLPSFPSITNLELRYSARLSQIDTTSDGRVVKWYDISGNARHTNTAAGTARPLYLPKRFNGGYPCIRFNGSSNRLTLPSFTLAQPFSVVAVMQNAQNQSGNQHLINLNGTVIIFIGSGPEWYMYAGANFNPAGAYSKTITDVISPDTTIPIVTSHVFNGASSVLRENATTNTGNPSTGGMASAGTIVIGCDQSFTVGSFLKMFMYELLIFSKALSAAEMTSLETYYNDSTVAGIVI